MDDSSQPTVVGIGELLWDMLPDGRQLGGAVTNFAYHCSRLGANACIASAVGMDDLGKAVFSRLGELGLSRSFVSIDTDHPTGTVDVSLASDGSPEFAIHEDVAWDHIPLSQELLDLAPSANAVCFGTLAQRSETSRSTITDFLSQTPDGCLWILDINLRKPFFDEDVVVSSIEAAHVLRLSSDELPAVAEFIGAPADVDALFSELFDSFDVSLIALTRGADGSLLANADGACDHKGFQVDVVDTVGAGDAFTAVVAMGLLAGHDIDTISEYANRLASFVCTCPGGTPDIPDDLFSS
ncbi:MAG: carbohydrate kinase [Planctomycetes bacterium]|nr:carbohydrate kinase [Planctomycetota bacterium]